MQSMEESIVEFLKSQDGPVHLVVIARHLEMGKKGRTRLKRVLKDLARERKVQRFGTAWGMAPPPDVFEGRFSQAKDGYGFVALDDQPGRDVFIPEFLVHDALQGDRVRMRITRVQGDRRSGEIVEVIERGTTRISGVLRKRGLHWYIDGEAAGLPDRVWIPEDARLDSDEGDAVGIVLTTWPEGGGTRFEGRVVQRFDAIPTVLAAVDKVVFEHGLAVDFAADVLEETERLPDEVRPEDLEGREDLRELPFVTIDGEDARDFDDAVCYLEGKGGGRLLVAIADVSHYVQLGTAVDREAQERGTSVYFPTRVLPMLPEKLSNGLCSLRPRVDRLAMVVDMELDRGCKPVESRVYAAVIHSHARLTYTMVERQLTDAKGERPPEALQPMIRALHGCSKQLFKDRMRSGSLDLEIPEPVFGVSSDGTRVESVLSRTRTKATGLIEELMLLANREVARRFLAADLPTAWRIHEDPDPAKIEAFMHMARTLLSGKDIPKKATPKAVQTVLERVKDPNRRIVLQSLLLRALQRARYAPDCIGHYGLGFEAYLHFTSPIRRYPDLLVHRVARRHLLDGGSPAGEGLRNAVARICMASSASEQAATKAERACQDALKAHFMSERVGTAYTGRIAGMISAGMFITLGDLPIEGFLPVAAFPPGDFVFEPDEFRVSGGPAKCMLLLGDLLEVEVSHVDLDERRITVALTEASWEALGGRGAP
jgi:ribonuclease R